MLRHVAHLWATSGRWLHGKRFISKGAHAPASHTRTHPAQAPLPSPLPVWWADLRGWRGACVRGASKGGHRRLHHRVAAATAQHRPPPPAAQHSTAGGATRRSAKPLPRQAAGSGQAAGRGACATPHALTCPHTHSHAAAALRFCCRLLGDPRMRPSSACGGNQPIKGNQSIKGCGWCGWCWRF